MSLKLAARDCHSLCRVISLRCGVIRHSWVKKSPPLKEIIKSRLSLYITTKLKEYAVLEHFDRIARRDTSN